MKTILAVLLIQMVSYVAAQWSGDYRGTVNGDPVQVHLMQQGQKVSGTMKDSYQTYAIVGDVDGNRLAADAVEASLGLTFALLGEMKGSDIHFNLIIELLGQRTETPFTVTRSSNSTAISAKSNKSTVTKIPFPADAQFPVALVGMWTKNETYNSGGYGGDFMGANFSQSMTFHADGTLSEGGSSATMSGSNYYGSSTEDGGGTLDGIGWYAVNNQLYLMIFDQNRWQNVHLGKWYVENRNLLITATSGEKLLLSK